MHHMPGDYRPIVTGSVQTLWTDDFQSMTSVYSATGFHDQSRGNIMNGVTVLARAKAKPGREAELEQAMRAVVMPTHQEAGCLRYTVHRSLVDPSVFITVEHWTSKEAIDGHFATGHVQTL